MIVTAVERMPKRRGRVQVYVDGVAAFEVPRATADKQDLRPARPIDAGEIAAIIAAEARRRAMDAAAGLLARRPRSERELRRRLAMRRVPAELADETIERLRSLKLIDDAAFARSWTETRDRTSPRGRRMIVAELRGHGVEATLARAATNDVDEADAAYRLASKRAARLAASDYAAFTSRLGGLLQRRGFGWEVTRATVARCWREYGDPSAAGERDAADDLIE